MLWKGQVIEMRKYTVTYTVEARNEHEADKKMSSGETVAEEDERLDEIVTREPWGPLFSVPKKGAKHAQP